MTPPAASFVFSVSGNTVQFTDTSSPAATFWAWDFADGNTSSLQNPSHTYSASGLYAVTLNIDPYSDLVVSQLDFHDSVSVSATGIGTGFASVAVTEDYKGVDWTIDVGGSGCTGAVDGALGLLSLGQYAPGFAVMDSAPTPALAAAGDFTMELTHNGVVAGSPWGASSIVYLLCAATPPTPGPNQTGDWGLSSQSNNLAFGVNSSPTTTAGVHTSGGFVYPRQVDNALAVTRHSGVLRLFLGGALIGTQSVDPDSTPLYDQITFGGAQQGRYEIPNNYGFGNFKNWRYTVGAARYIADYTVPTSFIDQVTRYVSVGQGVGMPPPRSLPTLPICRVVSTTPNYS